MKNKHYFLVVDDENNQDDLEDTIRHMGVSKELGLFASNYEDAVNILTSDKNKDIVICYVDYKIPKNNQHLKANYDDSDRCWGLNLIPQIKALNSRASIVVYSAYATKEYLQNEAGDFKQLVTAFFEKPNGLEERRQYYLNAIESTLEFRYEELDVQTRDILLDRTNKIKSLIKQTVQNMLMTGIYLNEVKQLLQHGQFIDWYKTELGISSASAWRIMTAAKRFENYNLEDLDFLGVATLYTLSDTDIPDRAIETIIQNKEQLKSFSHEDAKQLRQQFKVEKKQRKIDTKVKQRKIDTEIKSIPSVILASNNVLPQTDNRERIKLQDLSSIKTQETEPKQDIIQVIRKQRVWRIGNNQQHTIVAADPNSPDFLRELPANIHLLLAFPPDKNWNCQFEYSDSTNIFQSRYQDLDNLLLLTIVDGLIKLTTNAGDSVAICYIPEPKILSIVHQLGCRAYVADPDEQKCLDLISLFNQ